MDEKQVSHRRARTHTHTEKFAVFEAEVKIKNPVGL